MKEITLRDVLEYAYNQAYHDMKMHEKFLYDDELNDAESFWRGFIDQDKAMVDACFKFLSEDI